MCNICLWNNVIDYDQKHYNIFINLHFFHTYFVKDSLMKEDMQLYMCYNLQIFIFRYVIKTNCPSIVKMSSNNITTLLRKVNKIS